MDLIHDTTMKPHGEAFAVEVVAARHVGRGRLARGTGEPRVLPVRGTVRCGRSNFSRPEGRGYGATPVVLDWPAERRREVEHAGR